MNLLSATRLFLTSTAAGILLSTACLDTGTAPVSLRLYVTGSDSNRFESDEGWSVTLDEAQLALGTFTLCPAANAGSTCSTAVAEWLGSTVVDALDPDEQLAGMLLGSEGIVRGFMYDLGIVSLTTNVRPLELDAARALDGNSVRITGTATLNSQTLNFEASMPIFSQGGNGIGVPVRLSSAADDVNQELADVDSLTLRFAAEDWLSNVSFDQLAAANCEQDECPATLNFEPDTQAYRAFRLAVLANAPTFVWE